MSSTTFSHHARVVFIATLLWSIGGQAATLAIPDFPLFLTSAGVSPNIVLTLDDSLSMMRGYVPETVDNTQEVLDGPRFKSASVNGLYYDPTKVYKIPTRSDPTTYTTTFSNPYFNGFDPSKGQVGNLVSNYRVIAQSLTSQATNSSYSNCTTSISANNSDYSTCLYAKTPVEPLKVAAGCSISITNSGTNDYIQVNSPAGCTSIFTGITANTKVIIRSSGGVYTTYNVVSSPNASRIVIGNVVSSTSTLTGAKITWWNTTTSVVPAYYYVYWADRPGQSQPTNCSNERLDDNCYVKFVVSSTSGPGTQDINNDGVVNATDKNELQNFANWFSFYRTRALAVMSGAMSAVTSLDDDGGIRLGWHTINTCTSFTASGCQGYVSTNSENRLRTISIPRKTIFYNWLQRMNLSGSTPMRSALNRAGDYYKNNSQPYDFDPYITTTPLRSCRANFNVLFTDGLWNSETSYATPGSNANIDSTGSILLPADPDGVVVTYTPRAPYKDISNTNGLTTYTGGATGSISANYTNPNSLADTALYYWATDLRTGMGNNVPPRITEPSGDPSTQYWNPNNDPATWQHMVNFTIGLGLSASLVSNCYWDPQNLTKDPNNPTPGCPTLSDLEALKAGTRNWPAINAGIGSNYGHEPDGHVYDLWHAAINSRGKFYSADNPSDVVAAFQDVMDTISSVAKAGGGSKVSTNVQRTTDTNATGFVAGFGASWNGLLEARKLNADGTFETITNPDGSKSYVSWWEAGQLIPPGNLPQAPPYQRKIYTRNQGNAEEFVNCTGDLLEALKKITKADGTTVTDNLCSQRLAWLRGYIAITGASTWDSVNKQITFTAPNHGFKANDSVVVTGVTVTGSTPSVLNKTYVIASFTTHTFTVPLVTDPGGTYMLDEVDTNMGNDDRVRYAGFRDRPSVLGDIVDSGTVFVQKDNFGYGGDLIAVNGQSSYKSYVDGKASNPPVVYVGANDGMLHAFNANTDVNQGGGQELFAYVPSAVYGNLSALTDPAYGKAHKFFVDGTPTVGDAYIGSSWKTYLVGGLRAGGKSIYALDITNPDGFGAANVKWEFNDNNSPTTPGPDMGLTFGQPQIAAISANQWAAIFGNGYNSANGNAVLYIVDLSDGSMIAKITVPENSTTCGQPLSSNGLSTPYGFDQNGDGIVDVIYAGDLMGHLWRFDKSSGSWNVSNIFNNLARPLFTACNASNQAQSITAQPKAALVNGKLTVYFGTGRYLIADPQNSTNPLYNDLINSDVQTFYSIVDESETAPGTVPRNKLLPQTITQTNTPIGPYSGSRTVTNNKVTDPGYSDRTKGCYVDFTTTTPPAPSERITSGALIKVFKSAALESRVIFATSTPTSDPCATSGSSWLMELNTSCGRLNNTPFGTVDAAGNFTPLNQNVSGISLEGGQIGQTGLVNEITWIGGPADKGVAFKLLPGTTGKVQTVAQTDDACTDPCTCIDPPPPSCSSGGSLTPKRLSWEQIQ